MSAPDPPWPPAFPSPSGRYVVATEPWEARMSHWVLPPVVRDAPSGEVLLDLTHSLWSVETAAWHGESVVALTLREYPGDQPPVVVTLDLGRQTATVAGGTPRPFAEIEAALDAALPRDAMATVLGDTLGALDRSTESGPLATDLDAARAEVRAALDGLRAGREAPALGALFAPAGDLQEVAIANGWADLYLALARRYDRARHAPSVVRTPEPGGRAPIPSAPPGSVPASVPADVRRGRRRLSFRMRAVLAAGVSATIAWWLGGPRAVGGLAMLAAAAALPAAAAFAWLIQDPTTVLFSNSKRLRQRVLESLCRPVVLIAVVAGVALALALLTGGVGQIVEGVRAR